MRNTSKRETYRCKKIMRIVVEMGLEQKNRNDPKNYVHFIYARYDLR